MSPRRTNATVLASISNVPQLRSARRQSGAPTLDFTALAQRLATREQAGPGAARLDAAVAAVIDDDTRRVEVNTLQAPWLQVCSLEIRRGQVVSRGTGWLAGPSLVVTAGHCLFSVANGWANRVLVTPGRRGDLAPFGSHEATQFSVAEAWHARGAIEFDLGCIHLDERIGDALGWLAFDADALAVDDEVTVAGYGKFAGVYKNLLVGHGVVRALDGQTLYYDVDTADGQSGAPVWRKSTGTAAPVVVAVHTYEPQGTPRGAALNANAATQLTEELVGLIAGWELSASRDEL